MTWKRVIDMNDRALRDIVIGLGGRTEGIPRETGFDITAASEVMAILCLANGIPDLKARLGRIVVGYAPDGTPVTARDVKAVGAMAALLRDAIKPNLVQTTEGVPAFVHGGPFANIAHGTNSIAATRAALAYADIVVTEAGFAFELGAEKFFDINCRYGGFAPACTVLVATIRALKMHGGKPLAEVGQPDVGGDDAGAWPTSRSTSRTSASSTSPAWSRSTSSRPTPRRRSRRWSEHCDVARRRRPSRRGRSPRAARAARELAEVVRDLAARSEPQFTPLYDWNDSIEHKIATVAREMYGAAGRGLHDARPGATSSNSRRPGFGKLPVCIAKTQQSLSDNPALLGRPKDFLVTVREIQLAAGAGFVIPITGEIMRMPGLPKVADGEQVRPDRRRRDRVLANVADRRLPWRPDASM